MFTYVIHDLNICLHDKLHMYDICRTYIDICPIPIGTQVYPSLVTGNLAITCHELFGCHLSLAPIDIAKD